MGSLSPRPGSARPGRPGRVRPDLQAGQFAYIPPLASGLVTLAWIRQASGDPGGALAAIAEAKQASPGPAGPLNSVPARRARLLLAQGDLDEAARWTQENGVKKHVSHVLGKLGAASRTEAVARARELGLIR